MAPVKSKYFFIRLILISLAISPALALGEDNRNLFLIGVMFLSPIIIIRNPILTKNDLLLLIFMIAIIFSPLLFHPETMRWSTVMYSVMFCLTFIAYNCLLKSGSLTIFMYLKLLKYLILAYFVVLVIQQFCVLAGLPIFNISNYNILTPWKLNSLSAEPSHSARIVALLMYCYITVKELVINGKYNLKKDFKKDRWIWIAFIWTMVTMGSGTAILFLIIVFLKFIKFKNIISFFVVGCIILFVLDNFEITSAERLYKTSLSTITLQEDKIIEADHSAAVRIVPIILLLKMVGISSVNDWFGYGIDHVSTFLSDRIPGVPEGISGGGLFQLWIEYGVISFALFFIFSLINSYRKGDYSSILFWFMLVFLYGVNSQIVWLCIILLFTNKHFLKIKYNKVK